MTNLISNKKGIQMPVQTVALFIFVLATLGILFTYILTGTGIGSAGFRRIFEDPVEYLNESEVKADVIGAPFGGKCTGNPASSCGHFYQTAGGLSSGGGNCEVPSCSFVGCYPVDMWGNVIDCWWRDDNLNSKGPECCDGGPNDLDCSIYEGTRYAGYITTECGSTGSPPGYNEIRNCNYNGIGRCVRDPQRGSGYAGRNEAKCPDFTQFGQEKCELAGCDWTPYHVD